MPFISSRRFAASLPAAPFVIISRHRVTRVAETLHTPHSHQMTLPVMTRLVERANGPVCVPRVRNNTDCSVSNQKRDQIWLQL